MLLDFIRNHAVLLLLLPLALLPLQHQIAVGTAGPQQPDKMPEKISIPDRMPNRMSEGMQDRMPDRMSEELTDRKAEDISEDMPDRMPERESKDIPDRMPKELSEDARRNVRVRRYAR